VTKKHDYISLAD